MVDQEGGWRVIVTPNRSFAISSVIDNSVPSPGCMTSRRGAKTLLAHVELDHRCWRFVKATISSGIPSRAIVLHREHARGIIQANTRLLPISHPLPETSE
jgi:hypothetical protein